MDDEQQIRQLVSTWIEASKTGDTAAVLSLMADDVIFLTPGNPPMCGKTDFAAAQAGMDGFELEMDSEVQEIRVLGDWAYLRNHLRVEVTLPDGKFIKREGDTLSILEKRDGRWLLVRDANLLN